MDSLCSKNLPILQSFIYVKMRSTANVITRILKNIWLAASMIITSMLCCCSSKKSIE